MLEEFNAKPHDDRPIDLADVADKFIDSRLPSLLRYKTDMKTKRITGEINLETYLPRLVAIAALMALLLLALTGFRF